MYLNFIYVRDEDDPSDLIKGLLENILALLDTNVGNGTNVLATFPDLGSLAEGCRKLLLEEEKKEEEKRKKKIAKTQPKMAPKDNGNPPSSLALFNGSLMPSTTGTQDSQNHHDERNTTKEGRVGTDDKKSVLRPQTNNEGASKDSFSKASVPPASLMSSVPPASTTQNTN